MSYRLRRMLSDDVNRVHAIETCAHKIPWSRLTLNNCVRFGYEAWVIEINEANNWKIIGYIISRFQAHACHILNLCVDVAYQKRGYGSILLQSLIDSLTLLPVHTVFLEVRPSNACAIRLYEKMGFVRAGVKSNYYQNGHKREDAVVFQKSV